MVEAAGNNDVLESERLPNPFNDRVRTEVKAPPIIPLSAHTTPSCLEAAVKAQQTQQLSSSKKCASTAISCLIWTRWAI